jgi:hypothetical protein
MGKWIYVQQKKGTVLATEVQAHVSLQEADSPQLLYLFISPGYS